jgi:hypothetical protein
MTLSKRMLAHTHAHSRQRDPNAPPPRVLILVPRVLSTTLAHPHTFPAARPRTLLPPLPMVLAQAFQPEALLNVLEQRGVIWTQDG